MADHDLNAQTGTIPKRDPRLVMRLARLGSFHQCRLSFMRVLSRRIKQENWTFSRPRFEINDAGVGHAVYTAHTGERAYSLVAFAHDLPAELRSDRVIAEAWDATFCLYDGVPDDDDIERLSQNVPYQEAGRVSEKELSLSRANRSARLWAYVVSELSEGRQPDAKQISDVGYLMRTTAVYGSGKFGAADREKIANRPEFAAPFQAEMLSVYLTRTFVRDLVQHMADAKGGAKVARLDVDIARSMGIGNSTGLGMAPFILNHPVLFNNWINAREDAIARVRSVEFATPDEIALFKDLFERSGVSLSLWNSVHELQIAKTARLQEDYDKLAAHLAQTDLGAPQPWNNLHHWAEVNLREDGQEMLASLMLEPYGDLVDTLSDTMSNDAPSIPAIRGAETIGHIQGVLRDQYDWALSIDWDSQDAQARAWYVSEEKLEPRLGQRFEEKIAEYEQPLAPGRDVARLAAALEQEPSENTIAEFLLRHPEHRHIVRRLQAIDGSPYAEIRDNTISSTILPIDMLRCKLAFFGAIHFDPRSDRWVRICMFAGAPYPDELEHGDSEFWTYPKVAL